MHTLWRKFGKYKKSEVKIEVSDKATLQRSLLYLFMHYLSFH